jgi:hypothetical protein
MEIESTIDDFVARRIQVLLNKIPAVSTKVTAL